MEEGAEIRARDQEWVLLMQAPRSSHHVLQKAEFLEWEQELVAQFSKLTGPRADKLSDVAGLDD